MLIQHCFYIGDSEIVLCKELIYCRLCLFSGRYFVGNDIEWDFATLNDSSGKNIHCSIGT